jgi:hypothetical protein
MQFTHAPMGGQCGTQARRPGCAISVASYPLKPHEGVASAIGQLLRSMGFLEVGIVALLWAWMAGFRRWWELKFM